MNKTAVEKIEENQDKEITGGAAKVLGSGYCPFTPEHICRVDPVGGYYEENVKCQKCYWRE